MILCNQIIRSKNLKLIIIVSSITFPTQISHQKTKTHSFTIAILLAFSQSYGKILEEEKQLPFLIEAEEMKDINDKGASEEEGNAPKNAGEKLTKKEQAPTNSDHKLKRYRDLRCHTRPHNHWNYNKLLGEFKKHIKFS